MGGTPAKLIKMRFEPTIIKRIQSLEWWQYNLLDYELDWSDLEKTLTTLEILKNSGKLTPYIAPRYQLWNENGKIVGNQFKKVGVTFMQKLIDSRRFQPLGFHNESRTNRSS